MRDTDFVIIGGGVVGLTLALEGRRRHPDARIVVLEKEPEWGLHASGRNSGVVHAGFYYTADSLKARFTRDGNRELVAYCERRGVRVNQCGKLVVARDESEHAGLDELLRRGEANGVELHRVTEREAREKEPRVRTVGHALWSPSTASVDPTEVMRALAADAEKAGIDLQVGNPYLAPTDSGISTRDGELRARYVINAAGLHADRIARDFGFSRHYRILPFRGNYLQAVGGGGWLRVHVYPVPELDYPFLGVHYTVGVDGAVKVGPTAVPALWREQYGAVANFCPQGFLEIAALQARLLAGDAFRFRELAWREIRKRSPRFLVRQAACLAEPPESARWRRGRPGIRAQLVDTRTWDLVMDFVFEGDGRSFHVLNAVSPAFTCALPFARHSFDAIDAHLSGSGSKVERSRPSGVRSRVPEPKEVLR